MTAIEGIRKKSRLSMSSNLGLPPRGVKALPHTKFAFGSRIPITGKENNGSNVVPSIKPRARAADTSMIKQNIKRRRSVSHTPLVVPSVAPTLPTNAPPTSAATTNEDAIHTNHDHKPDIDIPHPPPIQFTITDVKDPDYWPSRRAYVQNACMELKKLKAQLLAL